jgi:tRNA(adenine34) deaminase
MVRLARALIGEPHHTENDPMAKDETFMRRALALAAEAQQSGEVPVGAVLVRGDSVVAEGANRPIAANDPTAHAEIEVLRSAGATLGTYRLNGTTLYVTLEPCVMCAAAIVHARVQRLVFGAWDPRAGGAGSITNVFELPGMNHRVDVFGGVLDEECGALIRNFFAARRRTEPGSP